MAQQEETRKLRNKLPVLLISTQQAKQANAYRFYTIFYLSCRIASALQGCIFLALCPTSPFTRNVRNKTLKTTIAQGLKCC